MTRRDATGIAIVAAAWCAAIALIDPRGDFPLHDDWVYDVSTWTFAQTGRFHFPSVAVVSLRAQVLWGALWTKLFGQSFEVLRASTLLLSLATLILVQRTLLRAGAKLSVSVFGALALLFNPVFLWTSCTFMTDVPYTFVAAVAFYLFARGIAEERIGWVVGGCVAVVVSWFIRQNGVINLFPPLALLLISRPRRWRALAAPLVAGGALFGAILLWKREWLSGSPQMFKVHYQVWLESSFRLPEQISLLFHYIVFNAVNAGLFFLPLTLPLVAIRNRSRAALALLGGIAVLIAWRVAWLAWNGYFVPYVARNLFSDILPGPIFFDFGVGPLTLYDVWRGAPYPFTMPHIARIVLTIAAATLATLLVWTLAAVRGKNVIARLAIASAVFGTLMLFASGLYYDRYALDSAWALAIALPLIVPWEKPLARGLGIAALVVLAFFSTFAVGEYFNWNRARWTAYRDLRAKGIAVTQIEGGAEADGLFELRDVTLAQARRGHAPRPYVIAFNVLPGYRVIARYPFSAFLGLRRAEILVLSGTSG
jgi:hypothetical protein